MANLKEVKKRISSVQSTQQITKAMKMVAAAKLRKAQDRIIQMRPYAQKLASILVGVSASLDTEENIFSEEREINAVLIIAVTSDRGLCGPFNANVYKATNTLIADKYADQFKEGSVTIMPIGKKALDYFSKRDFIVERKYAELFSHLNFDDAKNAAEFAMKAFEEKKFDAVEIVYNEFKNVATQIMCTERFLPIASNEEDTTETANDYIYQPNQKTLVEHLIPTSLKIKLYKALLESNASENGARMTAMDKATENAGDMLKELKLKYNQTRQAAITNEILEIVAGAEALG
ncbi:MAG: ATP synthase F1 subunit gamma [Cyclobacteriaceae bacterium]|nr:ATP synthase F1 subunit gamma [Cyclobacteriaceae bacterium]